MKVDLPPPVLNDSGSKLAVISAGEKPPTPAPAAPVLAATTVSQSQEPLKTSVIYQVMEGGHKVTFQVIDEQTGQVLLQVPPSQVLSSEEQLYEFLQKQARVPKGR